MILSNKDIKHIFEKLRVGLVPERGLDSYVVGNERELAEIGRQLEFVQGGEGNVKFLRGGYGCGKTFMARLAVIEAQKRGFATSFVVVSDNDLKFHRFDDVYRKVVAELGTSACPRGALGDILDRWIGNVEAALEDTLGEVDDATFDKAVLAKIEENLASMTGNQAPADFIRVIQKVFELKQAGQLSEAAGLLSWLSGSGNVAASVKKLAGIRGELGSRVAMDYLRGIVGIIHAAGYQGLLIVIDEAETILRMRKDSRHKSLNGLRQICDGAGGYPRLLWLFTGTPDFFESRHGVAGLPPLYDRIRFQERGGFASVTQPQLNLRPFDQDRLRKAAHKLRALYVGREHPELVELKITDEFIDKLVKSVSKGLKGHVGLVPRHFMREFVDIMDLVDQEPGFDPMKQFEKPYQVRELDDAEKAVIARGDSMLDADDGDDELVPEEEVW